MAIKGVILGDILGSQYRFYRPDDLNWETVPIVDESKAVFTDKTVMSLAIKKAVFENADCSSTMIDLGREYKDSGFDKFFIEWLNGDDHKPYNSNDSVAATLISYIGEFFSRLEDVRENASKIARLTHYNPEAVHAAIVTAVCVWLARHGAGKKDIYQYVLWEYPSNKYSYSINHSINFIRKKYIKTDRCCDTVPVAMRCFYDSTDCESFFRNIYSFECNSDILGAIAGGVAEEFYKGFGSIDADSIIKNSLDERLGKILFGDKYIKEKGAVLKSKLLSSGGSGKIDRSLITFGGAYVDYLNGGKTKPNYVIESALLDFSSKQNRQNNERVHTALLNAVKVGNHIILPGVNRYNTFSQMIMTDYLNKKDWAVVYTSQSKIDNNNRFDTYIQLPLVWVMQTVLKSNLAGICLNPQNGYLMDRALIGQLLSKANVSLEQQNEPVSVLFDKSSL